VSFESVVEGTGKVIDATGVAAIVIGAAASFVRVVLRRNDAEPYQRFRRQLGRSILLGLELLVAADIIRTVAVTPTLERISVLAGIVVIRTFLSFSLELEITGSWPWRRHEVARPADGSGAAS
jgi:uncharacterized membrane protein